MKLTYRAYDKMGQEVTDTMEAADRVQAAQSLRGRGLFVTEMNEASAPARGKRSGRRARSPGRRRLKDVAMFTRQLYVLVFSGTPLVQSLAALARQAREGTWRETISDIRRMVEEGAPLAEAMEAHPEYFDSVCCSLIKAGESGGSLGAMLDRLAKLTAKRVKLRNSILGAITYPCLLVTVAGGVLVLLLAFVIPRFATLFETLDVPLPGTTQALIALSSAARGYWWVLVLLMAAAAVAGKFWLGSPGGKRTVDTLLLRLPQIGAILRSFATARITRLLGVLLDTHVPVLEALRLVHDSTGNVHYAELLAQAEEAVSRGETISSAFARSKLISPSVSEAINSGEQSGQVGTLLLNIADFLDEENEVVVRSLTSILEPAILILLGLLVALVAISMFLPLFDLTAIVGG